MRPKRVASLLALILSVGVAPAQTARHRLLVIVSAEQTVTALSLADLRAIYLGQITRWPSRRRIVTVIPKLSSAEGQIFLKRVIGMAELDYVQYWIGMVFRGQAAAAPLVASSGDEARRFVVAHTNAVAIIADGPVDKNIRVLAIDGKSIDAAGYPLTW
jgi:ABC-type phosphate transport system substrate-binding protein